MSDSTLGILVLIGFVIFIVIWATRGPSEKTLENQRREKEHEIETEELEEEKEAVQRRRRIPSGRGMRVKAK